MSALRPLTTGELLDRTFSLYKDHFLLFVGIIALPHLFSLAFGLANVQLRSLLGFTGAGGNFEWTMVALAVAFTVGAIAQAATVVAVSELHLGRPTSVIDSYRRVKDSIVGVILLTFVMVLGVGIGAMFLFIPGIVLGMMWSLAVPAVVLEDSSLLEAMSRSANLTEGYRWRVFVIWVLFFVLSASVTLLLQWPIRAVALSAIRSHSAVIPLAWIRAASTVAGFMASCLAAPLATIAFSLLYYDLRVRKEAFDLQLMMDTLDGAQSAPGTSTQAVA